jgi:hypothetical protein
MAVFPNLASGQPVKYPLTRSNKFRTGVAVFTDMSEQRWSRGNGALAGFALVYNNISTADKETLRQFFSTTYGSYDATWQITINDPIGSPTTYYNCQFMPMQHFVAQETSFNRWRVTLQVRQTNSTNPVNTSASGAGG